MPQYNAPTLVTQILGPDIVLFWKSAVNAVRTITFSDIVNSVLSLLPQPQSVVSSIAALRAVDVTNIVTGAIANVSGYYTKADGGGGTFVFDSASAASDNGGTVIQPAVGAGRWIREVSSSYNILWFGAKRDGTTNAQAAYDAAYLVVQTAGGGTILFPAGSYVLNAYILDNNITLIGNTGTAELREVCFIPASAISPTLLIGNDSKYVYGAKIDGISVVGTTNSSAVAVAALRLAGGAYVSEFTGCNFSGGQKTVWVEGGDNFPCELNTFFGCNLRADYANASARGLYVKRHAGTDTTGTRWIGGHFNGQNFGYLIEIDGEFVYFDDVYCDMIGGHGLAINSLGGVLVGQNVVFDCPSGVVVKALTDTVADITRYINGSIRIDIGNLETATPTTYVLDGSFNFNPQSWNRTLKIGQFGSPITFVGTQTAGLDFGSINAQSSATLDVGVTGVSQQDAVIVTPYSGFVTGLIFDGIVSAGGVVTIRATNITGAPIDPPITTFRIAVFSFV